MGLIITVMFLPAALALALHIMTKRDEKRTNFEIEKETIFSKHANSANNTLPFPAPKLKMESEEDKNKKAA
ncbi:MAG: hypothetical protein QE271_00115 [Bacteriovoracaceae bacterium]|nr:hypothetical protein [Bacteriovoracaceae bacterium]